MPREWLLVHVVPLGSIKAIGFVVVEVPEVKKEPFSNNGGVDAAFATPLIKG